MTTSPNPYRGFRFPTEIIEHAVRLYHCFSLSFRDVQSRRDARAAKRLLRKLLKWQCRAPRVMVTDKLASYGAAKRTVMPSVEHRRHKGLNNRAENSHQPTRRQERQMKRFKSPGQAQRFLSAQDGINNLFLLRRHQVPAAQHRVARTQAFQVWAEVIGVAAAA